MRKSISICRIAWFVPLDSRGLGALQLLVTESQFFGGRVESENSSAFGASGNQQIFNRVAAFATLNRNRPFSTAPKSPDGKANHHHERDQRNQWKHGEENGGDTRHHHDDTR